MSGLQVEQLPIADVLLDPANVRAHPARNIEAIQASLARFGQQKPIIIDKDNIVRAGNGTLQAARDLGWEEISVVRSDLMGAEMTAFAIADNRTAELAAWDEDALWKMMEHLGGDDGEGCASLGFSAAELEAINPDYGAVGDPSAEWVGMPEYTHVDETSVRRIVVHFRSEEDVELFAEAIERSIGEKTRALWFPTEEIGRTAGKSYGDAP